MSRLTDVAKRNEYWEDLNYDERTDRLARLVTEMSRENARLQNRVTELEQDLRTHEHDEKGGVFRKQYVGGRDHDSYPSPGIATTGPRFNVHKLNPLNIRSLHEEEDNKEEANY